VIYNLLKMGKNNKLIEVIAPISGKIIELSKVPDRVFSEKLVGEGIAIEPYEETVVAPFNGMVKQIFPSGHAVLMESDTGLTLLIHIGIDTIDLLGKGFKVYASENSKVKTGDVLIKFEKDMITGLGYSLISPVVIPDDADKIKYIKVTEKEVVKSGEDLLMKVALK